MGGLVGKPEIMPAANTADVPVTCYREAGSRKPEAGKPGSPSERTGRKAEPRAVIGRELGERQAGLLFGPEDDSANEVKDPAPRVP